MPIHPVHSYDDPLLAPYRLLKDKELARDGGRFIAEGENIVRRLLASGMPIESILIAERKCSAISPLVPAHIPLFTAPDDLIKRVIGFKFHSGVLACGIRPVPPTLQFAIPAPPKPALITICQEIANTENLGAIIRISAAFGVNAIILGERCCDPFFRQSIRVSMGAIFSLPIVRSRNLIADLNTLSRDFAIQRLAAVLSKDAEPLKSIHPPPRTAVVFGNESQGLDQPTIDQCDRPITIPMQLGTDSLNVSVAAAVFLFHLTSGGI